MRRHCWNNNAPLQAGVYLSLSHTQFQPLTVSHIHKEDKIQKRLKLSRHWWSSNGPAFRDQRKSVWFSRWPKACTLLCESQFLPLKNVTIVCQGPLLHLCNNHGFYFLYLMLLPERPCWAWRSYCPLGPTNPDSIPQTPLSSDPYSLGSHICALTIQILTSD